VKSLLAALLIGLAAAGVSAAPKAKGPAFKTVTRKGLCAFRVPKDWKLKEDWKAAAPNASIEFMDAQAGPVLLQAAFYPAGDPTYPDLAAYAAQLQKPNSEFEKKVSSAAAALDGRPATSFHVEMLDMLWVTVKVGGKKTIKKDFRAAEYPGGFVVVSFSCPEKAYDDRVRDFERFLADFKLLTPKPLPLSPTLPPKGEGDAIKGSSGPVPSPRTP